MSNTSDETKIVEKGKPHFDYWGSLFKGWFDGVVKEEREFLTGFVKKALEDKLTEEDLNIAKRGSHSLAVSQIYEIITKYNSEDRETLRQKFDGVLRS